MRESAETKVMCEARIPSIGFFPLRIELTQCGERATAVYRYGCIHEHVREGSTCSNHHPDGKEIGCRLCLFFGHECPMVFTKLRDL